MQVQAKPEAAGSWQEGEESWLLALPVLFPSEQLGLSTLGRVGSLTAEEVDARALSCAVLASTKPFLIQIWWYSYHHRPL